MCVLCRASAGGGVLPPVLLLIAIYAPTFRWIALGAAVLAVVSQIDDRRGLSARIRFGVHVVVVGVAIAVATGPTGLSGWLALAAGFALVWLVNLYNFMDGSDGMAGGMTVIGFAAYAMAAMPRHPELALASAAVSGAGFGFLLLNFNPAKIFLGDAGSIPLGFFAGALGFWGWQHAAWPVWFPALVFSPFIADATATLLRRLARGEKFWQAHREHCYQHLVKLTDSHLDVALVYYLLSLAGALVAFAALHASVILQWTIAVAWYVVLVIIGWQIDCRWRQFNLSQDKNAI